MPWPNFGLTLKTKSQNHNVTFYRLPMGDLLFVSTTLSVRCIVASEGSWIEDIK